MNYTYILFIIIIILFYKIFNFSKYKNIENFANYKYIDNIILQKYKNTKDSYIVDFFSLRELSNISQQIFKNGLTIPGSVNIFNDINSIPKGIIIAYHELIAPSGWVLCDGNNGTPDLRGRFVRMSNDNISDFDKENKIFVGNNTDDNLLYLSNSHNNYASIILKHRFKSFGGTDIRSFSNSNELPIHTHNISSDGEHRHAGHNFPYYSGSSFVGSDSREHGYTYNGGAHVSAFKNMSTYKHTHDVSKVGGNEEFNNMPPYYVLTYIMKI